MIDGRIYHAGDTEAIEPPAHDVELALVPINGKVNNMDGVEAARLAHAMRAGLAVPMHFEHVRVQHRVARRVRRASASGSGSRTASCAPASGSSSSDTHSPPRITRSTLPVLVERDEVGRRRPARARCRCPRAAPGRYVAATSASPSDAPVKRA